MELVNKEKKTRGGVSKDIFWKRIEEQRGGKKKTKTKLQYKGILNV